MLYCVSEQKKNQVVKHRDKIVKAGFISRPIFPPSSNPPLFPRWPSNTAEAVKISSFFKLQHQFQCFHFTAVSLQLCLSAWSKNADWVRVTKMILVEWEYYIITIIPISQFLLRHSFIAWLWCIDLWFGPIMTDDKIKLIMDFWFRLGAHWGQAVYLTWQEIYVFIWVVCVCVCVCVCVWERDSPISGFWVGGWVSLWGRSHFVRYQKCNIPSSSVVSVGERKTTSGRKGLWDTVLMVICRSLALRVFLLGCVCVWAYLKRTECPYCSPRVWARRINAF